MKVKLLHYSPLWLAANAIRISRDNHDKSDSLQINNDASKCTCPRCGGLLRVDYDEAIGIELWCDKCSKELNTSFYFGTDHIGKKDKELIAKVGNKLRHKSVLEQLVYWFEIDGISRACLQELVRHRTARLTVKSTRYTLKELNKENIRWFSADGEVTDKAYNIVEKYCVIPPISEEDFSDIRIKIALATAIGSVATMEKSNDIIKYILPEAFKTKLQWQIDGRNLQNFLELRTSKEALWEIRELAYKIFENLPDDHKYHFEDYIKKD